jgi:threonine 3-dehydrogenase
MAILITGGTGFLGTSLARRLVERGEEVVLFATTPRLERLADIKDKIKFVAGDLKIWNDVLNAVRNNGIDGVFHMGGMLSTPSEKNPWASFETNVAGTMHVLEAARFFGVKRIFFASTSGTYGLGIGETVTEETLQRPTSAYGAGKLYGELLCRFYRRKFGVDVRALRYFAVTGPGARNIMITQYNSWMIENATLGKPYECFVSEDVQIPVTYFKDAIRATEMLYYAPKDKIKAVCYNVVGVSPAQKVKDLEMAIKKVIPDAKITYKPDPATMEMLRNYPIRKVDDSLARAEWGWEPVYTSFERIVEDFVKEVRTHPGWYGL